MWKDEGYNENGIKVEERQRGNKGERKLISQIDLEMKEKEGSNILTEDDIEMVDISESQMDTQIDLT